MDPKSTAKSKRSHSLHGRRTHPSPSSAAHKKPSKNPSGSRPPKLPSNWERYEDEVEEIEGEQTSILPKSKGADFGYLIEQAKSQELRVPSSLLSDEFSFDFWKASSFMVSARGETLLSLCEDDNFIIDDDFPPNYEVSSLSLDLKALASQISKLKISQRLFMEDFLFSDELSGYESKNNHNTSTLSSAKPGTEFSEQMTIETESGIDFPDQENMIIGIETESGIDFPEKENMINVQISSTGLDNALDDLLEENYKKVSSNLDAEMGQTGQMDESIDDLFERNLTDMKKGTKMNVIKPVDDFDSWFDSL